MHLFIVEGMRSVGVERVWPQTELLCRWSGMKARDRWPNCGAVQEGGRVLYILTRGNLN